MSNSSSFGRTPYDGKPYYCAACGLGLGEVLACNGGCEMESEEEAKQRAERKRTTHREGVANG